MPCIVSCVGWWQNFCMWCVMGVKNNQELNLKITVLMEEGEWQAHTHACSLTHTHTVVEDNWITVGRWHSEPGYDQPLLLCGGGEPDTLRVSGGSHKMLCTLSVVHSLTPPHTTSPPRALSPHSQCGISARVRDLQIASFTSCEVCVWDAGWASSQHVLGDPQIETKDPCGGVECCGALSGKGSGLN